MSKYAIRNIKTNKIVAVKESYEDCLEWVGDDKALFKIVKPII